MRLFEHSEFEQAMLRAAERFAVSEQFVEKDYYVTEILRVIAQRLGNRAMFKGGTSLSKGWGLITRFSEDIDLFVNPQRFTPRPGKNRMDQILKELAGTVAEHPALVCLGDESRTIGGLGREDYFAYQTHFDALPGVRSAVRGRASPDTSSRVATRSRGTSAPRSEKQPRAEPQRGNVWMSNATPSSERRCWNSRTRSNSRYVAQQRSASTTSRR